MKKSLLKVISTLLILAMLSVLCACGSSPEGEYAEQIKLANSLGRYRNGKNKIVRFYESYGDDKLPVLVLDFDTVLKVDEVCGKIKEKFKGADIPWLLTNFEDLVLDALSDNEFASVGVIVNSDISGKTDLMHYVPALDKINNLSRVKVSEFSNGNKAAELPDVIELITDAKLTLLDKCPNLQKLTIPGLSDPSAAVYIPTLKELYTDGTEYGKATAYAFSADNPQIKAYIVGEEEQCGDKYNHALQLYDISRIDTSAFTEIPLDEARLNGKIAVVGYGAAENAGGFDNPGKYISDMFLSKLTDSPTERDVVIRFTAKSEAVGRYTGGGTAYELTSYYEIIDINNKTITKKKSFALSGGDAVIINGKGKTSGNFSVTKAWDMASELFDTLYS